MTNRWWIHKCLWLFRPKDKKWKTYCRKVSLLSGDFTLTAFFKALTLEKKLWIVSGVLAYTNHKDLLPAKLTKLWRIHLLLFTALCQPGADLGSCHGLWLVTHIKLFLWVPRGVHFLQETVDLTLSSALEHVSTKKQINFIWWESSFVFWLACVTIMLTTSNNTPFPLCNLPVMS